MATQSDEKIGSDEELHLERGKSNPFMHEVHRQRKHSFSQQHEDSASDTPHNDSFENENKMDYLSQPGYNYNTPNFSPHLSHPHLNIMKRQNTETMLNTKPIKLRRRHSADKVLAKPTTKNPNSVDYLNRMVITLRSKITTYKEDLRIAAELGQKLFSQNAAKDLEIQHYKTENKKLKQRTEELRIEKDQLLQTTQLDDEHRKRLENDLNRQKSIHTVQQSSFAEENIRLKESLDTHLSDIRQLNLQIERQRLEIQTLDTRNAQNEQNAQELIDELSQELAEKTDQHSELRRKYQKLRDEYTKMKINCDKRGTEICNLKKENQEKNLKILEFEALNQKASEKANDDLDGANKQQIKLLYRQLENTKDEMNGISKHLDYCKQYLKQTMKYLEGTGLKMQSPLDEDNNLDAEEIYNLCKNARQFLGIDKPPPEIVYPTKEATPAAPDLPTERSPEPLPNDDDEPTLPSAPKEPTPPPPKVSQRETVPLQPVPAAPKDPTPPPQKPTTIPSQPLQPPTKRPKTKKKPKAKINSKAALPPSIPSVPETSNDIPPSLPSDAAHKPQPIPLPRPKTPKKQPKTYNLGMMPSAVLSPNPMSPSLPAPTAPPNRLKAAPLLPEVRQSQPKPKSFSSAMQPKQPQQQEPTFFPSVPSTPSQPTMPSMPSMPSPPRVKTKINATASMPPDMAPPAPRTPSFKGSDVPQPYLPPPPSPKLPKSKQYQLGVMPATVDEKPMESYKFPSVPPSVPTDKINPPSLPQEPEIKPSTSINAKAMAPPKPVEKPQSPPPMPQSPPSGGNIVPSPKEQKEPEMEDVKSGVSSNNEKKRKPKKSMAKKNKKSKKVKQKDTIEEQKQHLTVFFMTYSDSKAWEEGAKENGVQRYILKFANREPLNARMAFLYSMTLYLGQIVGVNKRCISHAFMLFKSVRAQIDTLSEEFALILQTLEHHNDDKLWKYVYSFLYNAAAYFKHIQRFVGTRTSVANPKQYSKHLRSQSRDHTNSMVSNRRESSYRKLSGLSEVSGQSADFGASTSNLSGFSNNSSNKYGKQVYGDMGPTPNMSDSTSSSSSKKKRKKKKSSYK